MRKKFSYDTLNDNLIISNKEENEIVRDNFEIGDIIFSLTGSGRIVSIEIREASLFAKSCGIPPELFKNLENAEFKVKYQRDSLFLAIRFIFKIDKQQIAKVIPIIVPMNRVIV